MVGVTVGRDSTHLYELVGEYVYVGWGRVVGEKSVWQMTIGEKT